MRPNWKITLRTSENSFVGVVDTAVGFHTRDSVGVRLLRINLCFNSHNCDHDVLFTWRSQDVSIQNAAEGCLVQIVGASLEPSQPILLTHLRFLGDWFGDLELACQSSQPIATSCADWTTCNVIKVSIQAWGLPSRFSLHTVLFGRFGGGWFGEFEIAGSLLGPARVCR